MFPASPRAEVAPHFRRRTGQLMVAVAVLFSIIVLRLWVLQVMEGDRFTDLSKNNRIRIKTIPGIRGMVFDRNGRLLVDSRPSFDLLFVPEDTKNPQETLRHLAGLLGVEEHKFLTELRQNRGRRPFREVTLETDIDWRSVVIVETHEMDLPGVSLRIRPKRTYLNRGVTAHLLGYLGEIGPAQLKSLRYEGYRMGDEIGQFGLEKSWEEDLRGHSGGQQVEVDALGRQVRVALGASRESVLGLVLREGLPLVASGLATGLAGAVALSRVLESMLFDVGTHDLAVFTAVPLVLAGVALVAMLIPARRAARVDPIRALGDSSP